MGLFKKPLSNFERQQIEGYNRQIEDSATLLNKTVDPAVYFMRLNFLFDLLLECTKFEGRIKFDKGSSPTDIFNRLQNNLEKSADEFINRACDRAMLKKSTLKSEKGRTKHTENFTSLMMSAFESSQKKWTGNGIWPHYEGPLYTEANRKNLEERLSSMK